MNPNVSAQKRRGAFYTPPWLVEHTLDRALRGPPSRALEPSAGAGAFLGPLRARCPRVQTVAVEREPGEAALCRLADPAARVHAESFFAFCEEDRADYDLLVGNPPFLRYQFVPPEDRAAATRLCAAAGFALAGVSNLWVPFVVIGLSRLRPGGRFGLVLPEELMTTVSAGLVRHALVSLSAELQVDRVPREAFPELLQDVIVVSGTRGSGTDGALLSGPGQAPSWRALPADGAPWTEALLPPSAREALAEVLALPGVRPLGELARFSVATVTGANEFFVVDEATVARWGLQRFARPALAHAPPELVFGPADFEDHRASGARCWLLDFSLAPLDGAARDYLRRGEEAGLPQRFKCRTREPWYAVPVVPPAELLLSKRAHRSHQLSRNLAAVVTTDTIYRGRASDPDGVLAAFHGTLTALGAELHGRSYGGGVLELVPSEVARLPVAAVVPAARVAALAPLPIEARREATDRLIAEALPAYGALLRSLEEGLEAMWGVRGR